MADLADGFALVIGIDDYQNRIPPLTSAVKDATKVAEVLAGKPHHGFTVTSMLDAAATVETVTNFLTHEISRAADSRR